MRKHKIEIVIDTNIYIYIYIIFYHLTFRLNPNFLPLHPFVYLQPKPIIYPKSLLGVFKDLCHQNNVGLSLLMENSPAGGGNAPEMNLKCATCWI